MKRSIYSFIHDDLKRILIVTLSISAVLLFVYTVISFKRTENNAERFVMNHVQRLAQAGVNAQAVGEIDSEIASFAQTWKETQDLDLRIDIFLNGKQISHAGQLRSFSYLSTFTGEQVSLASGDKLRVEIQIDLTGVILYGLVTLIVFECAIVALFYILRRSMRNSIRYVTQPLESKIAWLKEIAHDLPQSARDTGFFEQAEILEIDELGESIGSLTRQIVALEDNLAKVNFDRGRLKMAEQVAHNIKGVIATLQLKVNQIPLSSECERLGLTDCITSLQAISEDLLKAKKFQRGVESPLVSTYPIHLLPVLRSVVSLKREQYSNPRISIRLSEGERAMSHLVRLKATELQSVLSNLIDNSIEAFGKDGGQVVIETVASRSLVKILVRDNGSGIPEAILPSLMKEGFSYGKANGNGIGLFYAKEVIHAAGGEISISSHGAGTVVEMRLPLENTGDDEQVSVIQFRENATLVFVDDDSLVHLVWEQRLKPLMDKVASVVHLSSVAEFEDWLSVQGHGEFGSRLYLFDFDLKDSGKNGLDLISENGLALESILVSGMVENPEVRERASKMGLRRLSKDVLNAVSIEVEGHAQTVNG